MKRIAVALATVALAVPLAAHADPPCASGSCAPRDRRYQTVAVAQNMYLPNSTEARAGTDVLSFYDVDSYAHTVTHDGCLDDDAGTVCAFDLSLAPLTQDLTPYLTGRNTIPVGGGPFTPGATFASRCRIHDWMYGSFTVVR